MKKRSYQITDICRRHMEEYIQEGSICIDATMGNGNDTLWLCEQVGETGRVLAFDIQELALNHTKALLEEKLPYQNYELYLESHEWMDRHASNESVDCITFNLGYLPSGDHSIATCGDTTCKAIEKALNLLKKDGLLELCIYSGGDSGFEEKEQVLKFLKNLDRKHYLVMKMELLNRPNHPPMPVSIVKL